MDARSLALEMAPVIMWQNGQKPDFYCQYWHQPSKGVAKKNMDPTPNYSAWDMLSGKSSILLCLIQTHTQE